MGQCSETIFLKSFHSHALHYLVWWKLWMESNSSESKFIKLNILFPTYYLIIIIWFQGIWYSGAWFWHVSAAHPFLKNYIRTVHSSNTSYHYEFWCDASTLGSIQRFVHMCCIPESLWRSCLEQNKNSFYKVLRLAWKQLMFSELFAVHA